jgi:replication factor C large subunit
MATARREVLPYLSAITHHCKPRELTVAMAAYYEFDESHVSFVTGSGETTNKVQSIVEDAGELREELVEEHAAGAFAGMEGVSVDDDAAADGDDGNGADDGTDDVLDRDADADESAESDDTDASTDDGQSGLDDFF